MVDGYCYIKPNLVKKALKRSDFTTMDYVKSQQL